MFIAAYDHVIYFTLLSFKHRRDEMRIELSNPRIIDTVPTSLPSRALKPVNLKCIWDSPFLSLFTAPFLSTPPFTITSTFPFSSPPPFLSFLPHLSHLSLSLNVLAILSYPTLPWHFRHARLGVGLELGIGTEIAYFLPVVLKDAWTRIKAHGRARRCTRTDWLDWLNEWIVCCSLVICFCTYVNYRMFTMK